MFWEPPLLLSGFTRLFIHLSLYIRHMINTRRDTARTHCCPVGLVLGCFWDFLMIFAHFCLCRSSGDMDTAKSDLTNNNYIIDNSFFDYEDKSQQTLRSAIFKGIDDFWRNRSSAKAYATPTKEGIGKVSSLVIDQNPKPMAGKNKKRIETNTKNRTRRKIKNIYSLCISYTVYIYTICRYSWVNTVELPEKGTDGRTDGWTDGRKDRDTWNYSASKIAASKIAGSEIARPIIAHRY